MPRARDAVKERYWRKLIRRYESSGLGTRRFCDEVRVPEHRFHWWRRRLRQRDQLPTSRPNSHHAPGATHAAGSATDDGKAFLPVRLPFSLDSSIEVVHPRGYVIRVPALFDATLLQRVLIALDPPAAS